MLPLHPLSLVLSLAFFVSPCIMFAFLSSVLSRGISSFSSCDHPSFSYCFFFSLCCPSFTHELSITAAWGLLPCRLRAVILKRRDAARVHVSVCVCARLSAEDRMFLAALCHCNSCGLWSRLHPTPPFHHHQQRHHHDHHSIFRNLEGGGGAQLSYR